MIKRAFQQSKTRSNAIGDEGQSSEGVGALQLIDRSEVSNRDRNNE